MRCMVVGRGDPGVLAAGAAVRGRRPAGAGDGDAPAAARVQRRGPDDGPGAGGVEQPPGARVAGRAGPAEQGAPLGLLSVTDGLVPPILAALGASAPVLRAAIAERCRPAS